MYDNMVGTTIGSGWLDEYERTVQAIDEPIYCEECGDDVTREYAVEATNAILEIQDQIFADAVDEEYDSIMVKTLSYAFGISYPGIGTVATIAEAVADLRNYRNGETEFHKIDENVDEMLADVDRGQICGEMDMMVNEGGEWNAYCYEDLPE